MYSKKSFLITVFFLLINSIPLFADNNIFREINENWEFFCEKSPEEVFAGAEADCLIEVPEFWNKNVEKFTGSKNPRTYGCYRTTLKGLNPKQSYSILIKEQPATSCAVFINRELITQNGDPFAKLNNIPYNESQSKTYPVFASFHPDNGGQAEVLIFINNYFYRKSGLWDSVLFGTTTHITRINLILLIFYTVTAGILFFIAFLNLIQFFFNKRGLNYLYLSIASISFGLRILTAGYCSLSSLIGCLTAAVKIKLEYSVMYVAPICILMMLANLYPIKNQKIKNFESILRYVVISVGIIIGIVNFALPATYANEMVPLIQVYMGISCLYVLVLVIINSVLKRKYHLYYLLGMSVLILGGAIDVLYTKMKDLLPISFFPFAVVIFILIQIALLSAIENDIYKETIKISSDLQILNQAYLKFVPKEFLKLLNKDSIVNIQLGDYSKIEMSIIFSKINITCDEDEISQEEHFKIFNKYLAVISPIIKNHNGFVSKFLSGGFMALFPKSEVDSFLAAMEIEQKIKNLNEKGEFGDHKIIPRIGVHYGKMILGTIGEENRLDDTVISDTVNTVARIESVCERLDKNIIISNNLKERLTFSNEDEYKLTELESIFVKGKAQALQLFECVIGE